ncbi:MAG: aldo/keto reductase [Deltaproteobacteria bacterium]|nr:aldo/keto reductase [Deltaproteobacteria bacterium]MBW2396701.1 aldo/keto reductase [Deltaproteobacteria bacterium]
MPIPTQPFGRTGHESTRILFGAAALGGMRQEKADAVLEQLLEAGINHIDTAASYGDAELRIGPWMREHRKHFFLATKTGDREKAAARESLHRSLERLQVDAVDLIQLHNLVTDHDWEKALGPDGVLEALVEARDEGLVRFIGVTGHGTRVAAMHLRSLDRFSFDSVLFPYNYTMMAQPEYAADVEALISRCEEDSVALQTIKSVARRRWNGDETRRFSWYEPLLDPEPVRRAVHYVLAREGLFLNTSSDARLLPTTLAAAAEEPVAPPPEHLEADITRYEIQPLFTPGAHDSI